LYIIFFDDNIEWLKNTNLEARIAKLRAMSKWKGVEISDIKTSLAIYSGEEDIPLVKEGLLNNKDMLTKNNILLKVFEKLNHSELISISMGFRFYIKISLI